MKRIAIEKKVSPAIHDELMAAIPDILNIRNEGIFARYTVQSSANSAEIWIEDDIDAAAVEAVLKAHDPNKPIPETPQQKQRQEAKTAAQGLKPRALVKNLKDPSKLKAGDLAFAVYELARLNLYLISVIQDAGIALPDLDMESSDAPMG